MPAAFSPLAGDARIEFKLATTDPGGNPTDGVTRTRTTADSFDSTDKMKFSSSGGHDAWPSDEYLNLWVCQLSGGLLGYAQFPGGPFNTDGVVVTHTGFGNTGTAAPPFDKGRTTTHEIGHWLNLRHIWGDDGAGCSGSDFVSDTPNQGGSNTGKPVFPKVSCSNGPNGDMFMNYMDYVDDDTMVMFTEGQILRMQACLDGPRSAIGESISCDTVTKNIPKDNPKEFAKELPKDGPKDNPKEFTKELPKDNPKEFTKELPKDAPFDPGPVKTFLEPPIEFPVQQVQPTINPDVPFVLGTGAPQSLTPISGRAPDNVQMMAAYRQILEQYSRLNQRGMLDAQGQAGWQQVWVTYRQMGGE